MLSKRWQGLLMMVLAVTLTLGLASTAYAQSRDTGLAVVHAEDPDGAPLPGVMVVMRGPVGQQTQYTGIDGSARFPGLYPGAGYSATFALDGFTTVIRDGLEITANRVIDFTVEMTLATVEETITVTGASPLVDVKSTSIGGLVTSDLIEMSPSASGLWAGVLDKRDDCHLYILFEFHRDHIYWWIRRCTVHPRHQSIYRGQSLGRRPHLCSLCCPRETGYRYDARNLHLDSGPDPAGHHD